MKRFFAPLVLICALMFAAAPIADSFICGSADGDGGTVTAVVDADHPEPGKSPLDADMLCAHGHCHHASLDAPVQRAQLATIRLVTAAPNWANTTSLSSAYLASVERPPRA